MLHCASSVITWQPPDLRSMHHPWVPRVPAGPFADQMSVCNGLNVSKMCVVHSIPSFCSLITVRKSILRPTTAYRSARIPTAASKPSCSSAPARWRITTRTATRA